MTGGSKSKFLKRTCARIYSPGFHWMVRLVQLSGDEHMTRMHLAYSSLTPVDHRGEKDPGKKNETHVIGQVLDL